jgi:hypothetical protein
MPTQIGEPLASIAANKRSAKFSGIKEDPECWVLSEKSRV